VERDRRAGPASPGGSTPDAGAVRRTGSALTAPPWCGWSPGSGTSTRWNCSGWLTNCAFRPPTLSPRRRQPWCRAGIPCGPSPPRRNWSGSALMCFWTSTHATPNGWSTTGSCALRPACRSPPTTRLCSPGTHVASWVKRAARWGRWRRSPRGSRSICAWSTWTRRRLGHARHVQRSDHRCGPGSGQAALDRCSRDRSPPPTGRVHGRRRWSQRQPAGARAACGCVRR
jgi:hypothetical protein